MCAFRKRPSRWVRIQRRTRYYCTLVVQANIISSGGDGRLLDVLQGVLLSFVCVCVRVWCARACVCLLALVRCLGLNQVLYEQYKQKAKQLFVTDGSPLNPTRKAILHGGPVPPSRSTNFFTPSPALTAGCACRPCTSFVACCHVTGASCISRATTCRRHCFMTWTFSWTTPRDGNAAL